MKIVDTKDKSKIECQILPVSKGVIPVKKDRWSFDWKSVCRKQPDTVFVLVEISTQRLHGMIQLVRDEGMLIMELIELAPFNIGAMKEYRNVAGCLIAYGCREAIKLDSAYKGYLTFVSKSSLIELYKKEYYATQTLGARMYIDPVSGEKLIHEYL